MAQDDIQGQVVDPSGNPVSGAIVELTKSFESSPDTRGDVFRTTTDSNGNYIFEFHPDGDGTTQDYHVSCYNHDGTAYVNSFNNPGVTAALPEAVIPDSVVYQWRREEFASPWPANIGGIDMAVNGLATSNGLVTADGVDDFGSAANSSFFGRSEWGLAYTYQNSGASGPVTDEAVLGITEDGFANAARLSASARNTTGAVNFEQGDGGENFAGRETDFAVDDGNTHAIVINHPTDNPTDWEIYVDDMVTPAASSVTLNSGFDSGNYSQTADLYYWARNRLNQTDLAASQHGIGVFEFNSATYSQTEREGFLSRRPEV